MLLILHLWGIKYNNFNHIEGQNSSNLGAVIAP